MADFTRMLSYSRGRSTHDNRPEQREAASFEQFAAAILADRSTAKGQAYFCAPLALGEHSDQEHHPGQAHWRSKLLALPRRWLPFDLDGATPEAFGKLLDRLHRWKGFAYTTASHRPDSPRARFVLELSRAVNRDEGIRLGGAVQAWLQADGLQFDDSVYRAEQPCYGPLTGAEVFNFQGAPVDVDALLPPCVEPPARPRLPAATASPARLNGYGGAALRGAIERIAGAPDGERNCTLNREAYGIAQLEAGGVIPVGEGEPALAAAAESAGLPPQEVAATLRSAFHAGARLPRGVPERGRIVQAGSDPGIVTDEWHEPLPLAACGQPEPFPTEFLPDVLRNAVVEVQAFTKAPVALVAGSALAALSVSAQHLADVQRARGLSGPAGLFLLTIAESGERKTTCDGYFLDPVREWEAEQKRKAEPVLREYFGRLEAWKATGEGLKNKARHLAKQQKPAREVADALADHEAQKPEEPRVPRLVRVDETPESLAWGLAHEWPACGLISSEAGLVFGSHGMGRDSIMRNLGLFNQLWDGKPLPVSRRTSASFTVRGARLTVALQIQEPTLRAFFEDSGGLARGTGFLSRFLVAWPESTQGHRPFTEAGELVRLAGYQARLRGLLNTAPPITADGTLTLPVLELDQEAKAWWRRFYDDVERELRAGGEFADVRDVAAKAADNVARLACLFHVLERGPAGSITAASVEQAGHLVAWYLTEARRFYGALALPAEIVTAIKLEEWLVQRCRETGTDAVSTRDAQREGPYAVRRPGKLEAAMAVLGEADHIRELKEARRKLIQLNPGLLAP